MREVEAFCRLVSEKELGGKGVSVAGWIGKIILNLFFGVGGILGLGLRARAGKETLFESVT